MCYGTSSKLLPRLIRKRPLDKEGAQVSKIATVRRTSHSWNLIVRFAREHFNARFCFLFCKWSIHSLVSRGRDPSRLRQESRPLAASKTVSPRLTDSLSNLTNLIGWKIQNECSAHVNAQKFEFSIPDGDQKDRGLWGPEWIITHNNSVDTKKKRTTWSKSNTSRYQNT